MRIRWAVATVACLAAICEVNSVVVPVVVICMVMAAGDPAHILCFQNSTKQTCVCRRTAYHFPAVSNDFIVVVQVHVLRQGDVDEKEPFFFGSLLASLLPEPLDLVGLCAPVARDAQTIGVSSIHKPNVKHRLRSKF